MANWAVDPRPFVPKGFTLEAPAVRPPLRHEVYVTGCYSLRNEDLAIVRLNPPVRKEDFSILRTTLHNFFEEIHQVRVAEIQPCALGDAYVRFNTPLERERFIGPVFSFGNYAMSVIKHDEGENARSFELDREAWVLLVAFPEDLKNTAGIAKAVSGFGILVDWYECDNLARVVAEVYLNDDAKIPDSVKVNAGLPNKGCSWTVPCFVLKKNNVTVLPDEEAFVTMGPLHPMPPQPPCWDGPTPPAQSDATPAESNNGLGMNINGGGHWQEHVAPREIEEVEVGQNVTFPFEIQGNTIVVGSGIAGGHGATKGFLIRSVAHGPMPTLKSVIVGPSDPKHPLIPIVPSLIIKHGNQALEKLAIDYLEDDDDEDLDHEVLDAAPSIFQTPRKKKSSNAKEKLDDSFLRRNKRIAKKFDGYKDEESAKKAKAVMEDAGEADVEVEEEHVPLAMIPGPATTPHLPMEILEGIGKGFMQIQPVVVSAAPLLDD